MNRTNRQIEQGIARAVHAETPDALPQILQRINDEKEASPMTTHLAKAPSTNVVPFPQAAARKPARRRTLLAAISATAALILVLGSVFGYQLFVQPVSIIGFDVNPSVQLMVNRMDRVTSAVPANEEAQAILADMDLKNVELNVAVNALIGSMLKHGYISEISNSILITVDNNDSQKGAQLQQRLNEEVSSLLSSLSVDGAIISQTLTDDARLKELSEQYGISTGKAALIDQLVNQDTTLTFEGLAALSINDINLLSASRATPLTGVTASGSASSSAYIGEERALEMALTHAGVARDSLTKYENKLDYDDGNMVYEIEFSSNSIEYEYEIDAVTGDIMQHEMEAKHPSHTSSGNGEQGNTQRISEEQAQAIALRDAQFTTADVQFDKSVCYREDGQWQFDLVFRSNTHKYRYEVNAVSGDILSRKQIALGGAASTIGASASTPSPSQPAQNNMYIGADRAKAIAFAHAQIDGSTAKDVDVELDDEHGRMVYEVDFEQGDMEYEYEIDALTGDILTWNSERD